MQWPKIDSLGQQLRQALSLGACVIAVNKYPGVHLAFPAVDLGKAGFDKVDGCRFAGLNRSGSFVNGLHHIFVS